MATHRADTRIEAGTLTLQVTFDDDPRQGELRVTYVLRNAGPDAVAVFDRGDRQRVASGGLLAGTVPPPALERASDGGLVLTHVAHPLPQPSPTLPPTPLAARLAAGETLRGAFTASCLGTPPPRLRWCLGVTEFDAATFDQPQMRDGVSLWRASFAVVERQRRLCTPWFDPAVGMFTG